MSRMLTNVCLWIILYLKIGIDGLKLHRFDYERNRLVGRPKIVESRFQPSEMRFAESQSRSRSQFNLLLWLTNLIYPSQRKYGPEQGSDTKCPNWWIGKTNERPLSDDFYNSSYWAVDYKDGTLTYQSAYSGNEPKHGFPFFFLPRRPALQEALVMKGYQCRNGEISTSIKLLNARAAGILIRIYADRDFWAFMIEKGRTPYLWHAVNGSTSQKYTFPGPNIEAKKSYYLTVKEAMGNIRMECTDMEGGETQQGSYEMKDWSEVERDDQWVAGFWALDGDAVFKNPAIGEVQWGPKGEYDQVRTTATQNNPPIKPSTLGPMDWNSYKEAMESCPPGSLCAGEPYYYKEIVVK